MLYLYFGTDTAKVRAKAHGFLAEREAEGTSVERITANEWSPGMFVDLASAASLFGGERAYLFDTFSESGDAFDALLGARELLGESGNTFVIIEGALLAADKRALDAAAKTMEEYVAEGKQSFNSFALSDALLLRDKKSLWMLLARALREGLSGEEIAGTLYWQLKMLRLAERTKSAEEAGQKPFVYGKAKRGLASFKDGEPTELSRNLLSLYHDAHQGKRDLDLALEHFVLSL